MKLGIAGFGVWGRGLEGVAAFEEARANQFSALGDASFNNPKPQAVPPKERRRAGLMINLAVEVAHQACEHAGVDKTQIPSVFVSALGDTAITDYMCRKLSQPEKLLSPTKFHNSVHNAPSGYWTISAENRAPSSFVGGFQESFGAGLLEAASQAHAFSTPVLLVAYDIANTAPFEDIEPVSETLGVALVVTNGSLADNREAGVTKSTLACELEFEAESRATHSHPIATGLKKIAGANPIGSSLALLEQLTLSPQQRKNDLRFAAAPQATIKLGF